MLDNYLYLIKYRKPVYEQKKTPREKEVGKPGGLLIVRQENTSALLYGRLFWHPYRTIRLY
jgi:hypothetical protein